jgi:hypothetical protein
MFSPGNRIGKPGTDSGYIFIRAYFLRQLTGFIVEQAIDVFQELGIKATKKEPANQNKQTQQQKSIVDRKPDGQPLAIRVNQP